MFDTKDYQILSTLQQNSRTTASEIADLVKCPFRQRQNE